MEFCSEFGYNYGFNGSDKEDLSDDEGKNTKFKARRADTNIICIKFDDIVKPSDYAKDDVLSCKRCGAFISSISHKRVKKTIWKCEFCYEKNDVAQKMHFFHKYSNTNSIQYIVDSSEKNSNSVDYYSNKYLLCVDISEEMDREKKEIVNLSYSDIESDENLNELCFKSSTSSSFISFSGDEDNDANLSNIIVDENDIKINSISNNNYIITESDIELNDQIENIEQKISNLEEGQDLKQDLKDNLEELKMRQQVLHEQHFFKESIKKQDDKRIRDLQKHFSLCSSTNVRSYDQKMSYLDIVKYACSNNLDRLKHSSSLVSLLTFNSNELKYYNGSSTTPSLHLNNEKELLISDNLSKIAESVKENLDFNLNTIDSIIKNLTTQGNCSLMPALYLSIELASKQPGTQIIFFTSGNYDNIESDDLYNKITQYAKSKNVIVNIIVMEETTSKLGLLSKITSNTNGELFLANQYDMENKLNSIIEKRIIARNVSIKLISNHKYIYIRDDEFHKNEALAFNYKNSLSEEFKKSIVSKNINFLFQDIELTFEYGFKKKGSNYKKVINESPFQLQISYETENGIKIIRAFTKSQKFTNIREIAEKSLLSSEMIFLNACHQVTRSVINSNISYAILNAKIKEKMIEKNKLFIPRCYQETFNMIRNLSNEKTFNEIDDVDIEIVFLYSKISRNIFKVEVLDE